MGARTAVRDAFSTRARPPRARLRPARRPALPDGRHPLRHGAEQGPQGHRRPLAAADGQARASSGRAGTATACPSSSRSRKSWGRRPRTLDAPRVPRKNARQHALKFVDVMRTEFRRLGCLGDVGRPVPDALEGLRGDDRARSWPASRGRGSSTATRSRSTGASPTGRRWRRPRSSTRTTPRRRSTCASRSSAIWARRSRACAIARRPSSSGRPPPGRCRPTWPWSPIPSWTTSPSPSATRC